MSMIWIFSSASDLSDRGKIQDHVSSTHIFMCFRRGPRTIFPQLHRLLQKYTSHSMWNFIQPSICWIQMQWNSDSALFCFQCLNVTGKKSEWGRFHTFIYMWSFQGQTNWFYSIGWCTHINMHCLYVGKMWYGHGTWIRNTFPNCMLCFTILSAIQVMEC